MLILMFTLLGHATEKHSSNTIFHQDNPMTILLITLSITIAALSLWLFSKKKVEYCSP